MANDSESTSRRLNRLYKAADGEVSKKLTPDVEAFIVETIQGGHRLECPLADLGPLPPVGPARQAMAFGLNTVLGNELAGDKSTNPQGWIAKIADRWEAIKEGEWSEGRQGPRVKWIMEAWARYYTKKGKAPSEDQTAKMRKMLLAGEPTPAALLEAVPGIQIELDTLEAERAVAKAQASKEKLGATASEGEDSFAPQ